jgi:uncharacterized protein involved in exopolysaccharide biosynthesis
VGAVLFVVIATLGVALVLLSRAVYRAEAKLRLGEAPPMSGVSPTSGFFGLLRMGGDPFANDLELLASRTLAENVVDDVVLHATLIAPRGWHRDDLFQRLNADRTTGRTSYEIRWTAEGVIVTSGDSVTVRGHAGEELSFGAVRAVLKPWREGMPRAVKLNTIPHGEAARSLGGALLVERARRDANVIRLRYQATDPALTHAVVAAAVRRFIALRTSIMQRESGETVDSLQAVAARVRLELAGAEHQMEALQRTTGLIALEPQAEVAIERQADVSARLAQGRMELRALTTALERSQSAADPASSWAALLAYPRFLDNDAIADLLSRLTELEQERRELAHRRTADNLELRAVTEALEHLDASLRAIATDYHRALAAEITALEGQSGAMGRQLAAVPAQAIELGRRQRELRVLSEMLVMTEQRLRQEELRQALTFANVQVIDPPQLRDRPVWPRRKLGPLIALMFAGGTALLGMLVVERADLTVRSTAHVRDALGAPVLGSLVRRPAPGMRAADVAAVMRSAQSARDGAAHLTVVDVDDGTLAASVADTLRTSFAEAAARDQLTPDAMTAPCIQVLEPLTSYGAAAAAARRGRVIMAVEVGRTRRDVLERAAALLAETRADVAGAVLVSARTADAAEAWS